jgi:hypothetical protein
MRTAMKTLTITIATIALEFSVLPPPIAVGSPVDVVDELGEGLSVGLEVGVEVGELVEVDVSDVVGDVVVDDVEVSVDDVEIGVVEVEIPEVEDPVVPSGVDELAVGNVEKIVDVGTDVVADGEDGGALEVVPGPTVKVGSRVVLGDGRLVEVDAGDVRPPYTQTPSVPSGI